MITFNDGGTPPLQHETTNVVDLNHTYELDLDFPSEYEVYNNVSKKGNGYHQQRWTGNGQIVGVETNQD